MTEILKRTASLLRRFGLAGLLAVGPVVLLLELLDAAGGVQELHLAGEERMARRADFDVDGLARAARGKLVATTAGDGCVGVDGMDGLFHDSTSPGRTAGALKLALYLLTNSLTL